MGYHFKNFIYVHVPKTAGTFIIRNIQKNKEFKKSRFQGQHRPMWRLEEICHKLIQRPFESMTCFGTVRNPWARMFSCYQWAYRHKKGFPMYFSKNEKIDGDFNKWIEYIYSDNFDRSLNSGETNLWNGWFNNQLYYFKTKDQKHTYNCKIFKQENFKEELVPFFKYVLNLNPPDVNFIINGSGHKTHYSEVYNTKSIDLVGEHYSDDVELFDYKYEQIKI